MTVLTPFPNRASDQPLSNDNVSVLRTEINRLVNNAFENSIGLPAPVQPQAQAFRSVLLSLQAEINRIVGLLIQTLPTAPQPQVFTVPSAQTPFGAPAFGPAIPAAYGPAPAYAPVQGGFPVQSFGPVQGYGPVQSFGPAPLGFSQPAQTLAVSAPGATPATFAVTLLAEINRVFTLALQDPNLTAQGSASGPLSLPQNAVGFLQSEINRAFNTVLQGQTGTAGNTASGDTTFGFTPRVNLVETTDAIEIEAELPGFADSDIDLSVNGNVITIKGWRRRAANENAREFHILERGYGTFSRSLTLPFEVDPNLIRATFNAGVLTVEITKPDTVRESTHRIDIARAS